jgi:hypothetical protein
MKVTVNDNNKKEFEFPCLMKHRITGVVYLITSIKEDCAKGMLLTNNAIVFEYDWKLEDLEPFNGSITLEND